MTNIDPDRHSAGGSSGANRGANMSEPVTHDAAPVRTSGQARQAPPGRPVLLVLVAGLVLAMIAWAAVEFFPSESSRVSESGGSSTAGTSQQQQQPTAGGIPLSPPAGSPEGSPSDGQTSPGAPGRGGTSAPSPTSDSAR